MIKPLNMPQLSSAKPRTGLHSVADLVPRLIRQYELQAEMLQRASTRSNKPAQALNPAAATVTLTTAPAQQTTFGWE